jgi:hypothetical protein
MELEQASAFLAGAILMVSGCLVILSGIIIGNNLVAKYWKSWGWDFSSWNVRPIEYLSDEDADRIARRITAAQSQTK